MFVITGVESTDFLPRPRTGVFPGLLGQRISLTYQRQTGHGTRNVRAVNGPLSHGGHFVPRYQSSFVLPVLVPKFFIARSREVKQSFFSLSRQYGRRVNKAHVQSDHGRQCECECRLLPQDCRANKHVTCERTTQTREEYASPEAILREQGLLHFIVTNFLVKKLSRLLGCANVYSTSRSWKE